MEEAAAVFYVKEVEKANGSKRGNEFIEQKRNEERRTLGLAVYKHAKGRLLYYRRRRKLYTWLK